MTERITAGLAQKAKRTPANRRGDLEDSEITGFGVRIFAPTKRHATGARSFFINYRMEGREKQFTIGSYPDWSAAAARAKTRNSAGGSIGAKIRRKEGPARGAHCSRPRPTVQRRAPAEEGGQFADERLGNNSKRSCRDRRPQGGGRARRRHRGPPPRHYERGRAVRANRVLAVASKMFSLALRRKEGEDAPWRNQAQGNACKGAARNPEEGHERFFSPAELAAFSDALATYGQTPAAGLPALHHVDRLPAGRGDPRNMGSVRRRARLLGQAKRPYQAA